MTTDTTWDSARWRETQHLSYYEGELRSQPSTVNLTSQNITPDSSFSQPWNTKSHANNDKHSQTRELPPLTEPYKNDASSFRTRLHERHSPPSSGTYGPQKLNSFSVTNSAWQNMSFDGARANDTPLTLQIPKTQDLPRISPAYNTSVNDAKRYNTGSQTPRSQSQHTTSLPSFATFQEHAGRIDDPEEVEIAPMSARLSCSLCTKLKPLVRDVAIAVAEIDENVQSFCNKSVNRTIDFPNDSPVRTIQWILERLNYAKGDLQIATRRKQLNDYQHPPGSLLGRRGSDVSPPATFKRSADQLDHDDLPSSKRMRSGPSPDGIQHTTSASVRDDRRPSLDFSNKDYMPKGSYSPPPTESAPNSAYPKTGSPVLPGRSLRALPSPSSLAYPPSAAPSLAPPTVQSIGSPATSYQPAPSIHTASTSSATSAHLADLQHQVTLKSLALQTLQSEYASLLQKLQRERVKSQTIEKKTNVADQEVNDLTTKNEDLREQIKNLEVQFEESERKRETERTDFTKEKDQWSRMLELGGRLHAKNGGDIQKLKNENADLLRRIAEYDQGGITQQDQPRPASTPLYVPQSLPMDMSLKSSPTIQEDRASDSQHQPLRDKSGDVVGLKREIAELRSRNDILRFSLEETKRHNQQLEDGAKEVLRRSNEINGVIHRGFIEEQPSMKTQPTESKRSKKNVSGRSTPGAAHAFGVPSGTIPKSPRPSGPQSSVPSTESSASSTTMASVARAVSPGPEELGFHVTPSTSSPEELIKALGPVPAPSLNTQKGTKSFATPSDDFQRRHDDGSWSQRGAQPLTPFDPWTPLNLSEQGSNDKRQLGAFRPLTHHLPAPYASVDKVPSRHETSPHSYHSSPGPMMDDSRSTSSGSAKSQSPDRSLPMQHQPPDGSYYQAAEVHARNGGKDPSPSSSMPPPPKPSLPPIHTGQFDSNMGAGKPSY